MACATENGSIQIIDVQSNKVVTNEFKAHQGSSVSCVSFESTGLLLTSTGHDGSLNLWDIKKVHNGILNLLDTVEQAHQSKHSEGATCVAIQGSWVVSGGGDGNVKVFEIV